MYFSLRGPGTLLDGPEIMTDMFVGDITEGIAGTGIKAAILKCATDEPGVTPGVERVLRAVAQAHRQTGVPISTHTHAATRRGLEQQRIFAEEGVDLSRVVIGHCGDTTDIGYLEELIGNGSYIGMDRFGLDTLPDHRGTGEHRGDDVRARARRQDGAVATTPRASSTGCRRSSSPSRCRTGTTCTPFGGIMGGLPIVVPPDPPVPDPLLLPPVPAPGIPEEMLGSVLQADRMRKIEPTRQARECIDVSVGGPAGPPRLHGTLRVG